MNFKDTHETFLNALIRCDPITTDGKEKLNILKKQGLKANVTPSYFYDNLRVPSIYESDKDGAGNDRKYEDFNDPAEMQTGIFRAYTIEEEQYNDAKEHHRILMDSISGTAHYAPVYLFQGVTGNGKSIEINRIIRKHTFNSESESYSSQYILFDFEKARSSYKRGGIFEVCDDSIIAVFSVSIFSGIMHYIEDLGALRQTVLKNYNEYMKPRCLGSDEEQKVIEKIGELTENAPGKIRELFLALKGVATTGDAKTNNSKSRIKNLLHLLMWVMFCVNPYQQCRIVFDNIETYITLDGYRVQIPNGDIMELYEAVKYAVNDMNLEMEQHYGAETSCFSAFFVVRRTTLGFMDKKFLQQDTEKYKITDDLTGQFQTWEIWEKKRDHLWKGDLETVYAEEEYKTLVDVMDIIMAKKSGTVGKSYQSLIAGLMCYGIRRNGSAQAHAAYMTCIYLCNSIMSKYTMGYARFRGLMDKIAEGAEWSSARYMVRRALIEIQFKWAVRQAGWKDLHIGYVEGKEKRVVISGITENLLSQPLNLPERNSSLVSRILSFLSYHRQGRTYETSFWEKTPSDMFDTVPLYDLVRKILIPPCDESKAEGYKSIKDDEYRSFATTLIALANMDFDLTKRSPYVILNVDNKSFHRSSDAPKTLADLLKRIAWSHETEREEGGEYDSSKYNARITDGGFWFLHLWLHNFSYFSAITCYSIPPLFFLSNRPLIAHVIEAIYDTAKTMCDMYKKDANIFLGEENIKAGRNSLMGLYIRPSRDGEEVTFQQLVRAQHMNHLHNYRDYINHCYQEIGLTEEDKNNIAGPGGLIEQYMEKYNNWSDRFEDENTKEMRVIECF